MEYKFTTSQVTSKDMEPWKVNISFFSASGTFGIIIKQVIRQSWFKIQGTFVCGSKSPLLYVLPVCVAKVKDLNYCQSTFHNFRGDVIRLSPVVRV